jgi:glutamine cyclotransferase
MLFRRVLPYPILFLLLACGNGGGTSTDANGSGTGLNEPPPIPYSVVNAYPHDTAAFTQGLEIYDGRLYESTGLFGRSSLRINDLTSGGVRQRVDLASEYFAEGITILNDTLYQLTWQNHEVIVYRAKDMKPVRRMAWSAEGWGITHDSAHLYISDGSDKLYVVNPADLKLKRVVSVSDNAGPVNNLNELEWVDGSIYANRWQYDQILRIDPATGMVTGRLDLTDLLKRNSRSDLSYLTKPGSAAEINGAVLNGIAWDAARKRLLVTGKLWPEIFELSIGP